MVFGSRNRFTGHRSAGLVELVPRQIVNPACSKALKLLSYKHTTKVFITDQISNGDAKKNGSESGILATER